MVKYAYKTNILKCFRMKDIENKLDKQNDLLRLIVDKIEMAQEARPHPQPTTKRAIARKQPVERTAKQDSTVQKVILPYFYLYYFCINIVILF